MSWEPSTKSTGYDESRVAGLEPIRGALADLALPPLRSRKLAIILGALETQIEDGGDHPEVNRLLLEALRVGALHQVGKRRARALLKALAAFEDAEAERWELLRAGKLPPIDLGLQGRIEELQAQGYRLTRRRKFAAAVDAWLEAWELVKELATPEMRTADAFDAAFPDLYDLVFNWSSDLEMELGNAGLDNPVYHEHRIRFADEFLAQFSDEDDRRWVQMLRAKGEALFRLGRSDEADEVYRTLIKRCPDEAWSHIGWSDGYTEGFGTEEDLDRAEEILKQALGRPELRDREDALERLAMLYAKQGRTDDCARVVDEFSGARRDGLLNQLSRFGFSVPVRDGSDLGRNDPCWCGSGKKYKHCHWREDHR